MPSKHTGAKTTNDLIDVSPEPLNQSFLLKSNLWQDWIDLTLEDPLYVDREELIWTADDFLKPSRKQKSSKH